MPKMILSAALVSLLAISGHAQTKGPSYTLRAQKVERIGQTITLTGDVVIVFQGMEIRTDRAVVTLPDHPGR